MLITTSPQQTLSETVLPPGYQDLPRELAAVDALLDDPVFFQPYRAHFSLWFGRPSIPIETYLRMMFLKHRYRLGYETLCREVADSLSWSRFCRIPLGTRVPAPSTLSKITTRCGPETIAQLNAALLAKADSAKVVRTDKVRADTTVVAANVAYPTDSGLLTRAIALIMTLVTVIHAAGAASRTRVRDRRRAAGRRARTLAAHLKLRNDEAKARVLALTGQLADWTAPGPLEAGFSRRSVDLTVLIVTWFLRPGQDRRRAGAVQVEPPQRAQRARRNDLDGTEHRRMIEGGGSGASQATPGAGAGSVRLAAPWVGSLGGFAGRRGAAAMQLGR